MAVTGDTGNTATLTLSGFSGKIRSMTLSEETRQAVNASYLGDTSELYIVGDTIERGQMEFEWVFDPTAAMPSITAAAASITVTFPKMNSGSAAAATLIGTGFLTMRKYPDFANNTLNVGRGTIKWDGDTDPAFTVEA